MSRSLISCRLTALQAVGRSIDGFDNPVRRHSTPDDLAPVQFEKLAR
jgi:hypothetical protein